MTTYIYVGPTSAGLADGTSWANRYGTLNAAEDRPIVADTVVYVGPGVYRETLTCDVSGTPGLAIAYTGDYTGANSDGVGGVVRITGAAANDQSASRANCIIGSAKDYRTFTGFRFDTTSAVLVQNTTGIGWIVQKCYFEGTGVNDSLKFINSAGVTDTAATVQNCAFMHTLYARGVNFGSVNATTSTNVVSNCIFYGGTGSYNGGVTSNRVGGVAVRNCFFTGWGNGAVWVGIALPVGYAPVTVNNCIMVANNKAFTAQASGEIVENYNNLWANTTARTNVAVGANSLAYPPLLDSRWFFQLVNEGAGPSSATQVVTPFDLGAWSALLNVAGTSPTTTDMRGTAVQGAQREWGPLEYDSTLNIEAGGGSGGPVRILPLLGSIG
jgi:hypothetical protein